MNVKPPTKADRERYDRIAALGCLVCGDGLRTYCESAIKIGLKQGPNPVSALTVTSDRSAHMAAKPLPSQDVLRQLFAYEPETGFLRWTGNLRIFPLRYKGKRAFICKTNKGYFRGGMVGRNVMAHRVVWKWHNGTEPTEIDHIDGNPSNNKIENLRAATRQDNVRNTCIRKNNTTGAQGVHFRRNRFEAGIRDGERVIYLGRFKTLNAAKEARAAAEAKFGYHPNHGRPANG